MNWLVDSAHTIASFILVISVIVFIHEFGHYLAARLCGVKVEEFSIGFGKRLFGWRDDHGTDWKVSLLPIGGYVKMFGDADGSSRPDYHRPMTAAEKDVSFLHKPLWKKAIIVGAGPLANFVLAIAIISLFFYWVGKPTTLPVAETIIPGSAAEKAGVEKGDLFLTMDGEKVETFDDLARITRMHPGIAMEVTLRRGKEIKKLTLTPEFHADKDLLGNEVRIGRLGVSSQTITYAALGPASALTSAVGETYKMCRDTLKALGQMITGQRDASDLGGPIKIAKYSGQSAEKGWETMLWFIAVLSVNLGLINLFPIPMLDGGHLLFYVLEAVRRKPLGEKLQEYSFRAGFAIIIGLMVFTTANDIWQLIVK